MSFQIVKFLALFGLMVSGLAGRFKGSDLLSFWQIYLWEQIVKFLADVLPAGFLAKRFEEGNLLSFWHIFVLMNEAVNFLAYSFEGEIVNLVLFG